MSKVITVQYKFVFESVEVVHAYGSWLTLKAKKGQNKCRKKNHKIESAYVFSLTTLKRKLNGKKNMVSSLSISQYYLSVVTQEFVFENSTFYK